jgi:hypothetical protein
LASATGFSVFTKAVVDVDSRLELATIQSVAGSTITLLLSFAHSGTYPVTTEGGESMVRQQLGRILTLNARLDKASGLAGLKKADEVEWYDSYHGQSPVYAALIRQRDVLRDELCSMLGIENLWRRRSSGGQVCSLY